MEEKLEKLTEKIKQVWKSKNFDPNGSYTGNSSEKEKPIQDQDDL